MNKSFILQQIPNYLMRLKSKRTGRLRHENVHNLIYTLRAICTRWQQGQKQIKIV